MTSTEKWNKICDYFEAYRDKNEEQIQKLWGLLFAEIFGYSILEGDIEEHRKMRLGSTDRLIPDIILKKNGTDLFMVELKTEDKQPNDGDKEQLYSYLKQTRNDIGILICSKICLIDYNYNTPDNEQICCEIEFYKDNPIGIKFIETFEKKNISKENAKFFVKECIESSENIENIKKILTADFIKNTLKKQLLNNYPESDIDVVLNKFDFSSLFRIHEKKVFIVNTTQPTTNDITRPTTSISSNVDKSLQEIVRRKLDSVGKTTFIKYFEYYNNPNYKTGDIVNLFKQYESETFNPKSMSSKASTGKSIINNGYTKIALEICADANFIEPEQQEKAREYLKLFQ